VLISVETLNAIACQQLDKLEHDYPIITKPTEEVLLYWHCYFLHSEYFLLTVHVVCSFSEYQCRWLCIVYVNPHGCFLQVKCFKMWEKFILPCLTIGGRCINPYLTLRTLYCAQYTSHINCNSLPHHLHHISDTVLFKTELFPGAYIANLGDLLSAVYTWLHHYYYYY